MAKPWCSFFSVW